MRAEGSRRERSSRAGSVPARPVSNPDRDADRPVSGRSTTFTSSACRRTTPETYRAKIAAVTPEQVKSATATLLGSENSVIAIVGDYAKVKDQLGAFKDITFLDLDGKPIPPPGG